MKYLFALAAGWSLTGVAWACSCADDGPVALPADGATGVATTAAPLFVYEFGGAGSLSMHVVDPYEEVAGASVTSDSAGDEQYVRFQPDAALEAGQTYGVTDGAMTVQFTTGGSPDTTAPDAPSVAGVTASASRAFEVECDVIQESSCDPFAHVGVSIAVAEEGLLHEAEATIDGVAYTVLSPGDRISLGGGACLSNVPAALDAETVALRLRAVDLSGNTSAWTDLGDVALEWPEDADCDGKDTECSAATTGGSWWLLALAAVGFRRRT